MTSDDTTLKDFTDQIDKLNTRMATEQKRLKAQFAAMETALNNSQTQQAWLTSQIATLPRDRPQGWSAPRRSSDRSPSLPNQEPSLATYAGNQTAAYKQQSILTAPPGRLVVMLYDGCLRFLFQSAYAMREGERSQSQDRMRRAEAIIDELTVTLDHERGGQVASNLQGIYAFCRRHLIEAWPSRTRPRSRRSPSCSASSARPGRRSPGHDLPRPPGPNWSCSPSASAT